ncbi:MAG: hypothetical protein ACOCXM_10410, partial [Myxococcota bacterium]
GVNFGDAFTFKFRDTPWGIPVAATGAAATQTGIGPVTRSTTARGKVLRVPVGGGVPFLAVRFSWTSTVDMDG